MNDTKTPAGAAPTKEALLEQDKAEQLKSEAQLEARKKAQDLHDKNQFTEAFASKGAAHGNF